MRKQQNDHVYLVQLDNICGSNPRHKHRLCEESRTRRVQILVQPTLYHDIKSKADVEGTSVNDVIHHLLEAVRK